MICKRVELHVGYHNNFFFLAGDGVLYLKRTNEHRNHPGKIFAYPDFKR